MRYLPNQREQLLCRTPFGVYSFCLDGLLPYRFTNITEKISKLYNPAIPGV